MAPGAVYIRVEDVNDAMNKVARIFYARPSDKMKMYGVTGTNGKSTITNIIRDIINDKTPCGYIGTIAIKYGDIELQPNLTTPDALFLQSKLADMVRCGMKACALEVSSHGLAQHRVDGISFDCAIFTNLTYDHLDFHGTMENYFEAKSLLFKNLVKEDGVSVINKDDEKYGALKDCSKARVISYAINSEADYRAINIKMSSQGTQFDLVYSGHMYPVKTNLVGNFNVYNLLAAIAALNETGYDLERIIEKCAHIAQVEGRMERIDCGQPYNVIVDFAHTPDGMEKMMQFGRSVTMPGHRLIAVFGSAGKRDVHKRKVFGELADKYCDYIIVTEDDPRDEDPKEIAEQINILGDDGVPVEYHVIFWKSELIDFVILQQDAFDEVDSVTPMERQEAILNMIIDICHTEFEFENFNEVMDYFKKMINVCKQMNYSKFKSEQYEGFQQQLKELIAERSVK